MVDQEKEIRDKLIQLIRYSLHGKTVDPAFLSEEESEQILKISRYHKISALVSLAMKDPDETWMNERMNAIRRTILFDHEREEILKDLEKNQIWYCPLKGIILKDDYPEYGVREMSDNDILVDPDRMKDVRKIMKDHGYECILFGRWNHDTYHKEPIYNFEMHRDVFYRSTLNHFYDYYQNVKDRLLKDNDNQYGYHFSDEDFYIHCIAHNCKHMESGGAGLRILVDIYLYLKHHDLDWNYLEEELTKLGISEEESLYRDLVQKLFSDEEQEELNEKEKILIDYMFSSGAHGNIRNHTINALNRVKEEEGSSYKLKYVYRRIVLPESSLKMYHPFFYKHVWARPFLTLFRIGRGLIKGRKNLKTEIKTLIEEGKEDA